MGVSIKTTLNKFKYKDILIQLILINVAVFVILGLIRVIAVLFELDILNFSRYIEVSSDIGIAITHFWTLFTYMFVHYDFLHILFNMLMLYWFGKIFLMYFTSKNLVALYILGGLAGALFYILTFNTIPYFVRLGDSYMIGASASVMAVIFGAAFYNKNQEVGLLFIGRIKIVYIALIIFVLDFLALGTGNNQGGHIAHIGGAIIGYWFAIRMRSGKDITKGINRFFDRIVNMFKPKPKMRVTTHNEREKDYEFNKRKHNDAEEIDRILDKIKKSGYSSLNNEEKKRLFDASNK